MASVSERAMPQPAGPGFQRVCYQIDPLHALQPGRWQPLPDVTVCVHEDYYPVFPCTPDMRTKDMCYDLNLLSILARAGQEGMWPNDFRASNENDNAEALRGLRNTSGILWGRMPTRIQTAWGEHWKRPWHRSQESKIKVHVQTESLNGANKVVILWERQAVSIKVEVFLVVRRQQIQDPTSDLCLERFTFESPDFINCAVYYMNHEPHLITREVFNVVETMCSEATWKRLMDEWADIQKAGQEWWRSREEGETERHVLMLEELLEICTCNEERMESRDPMRSDEMNLDREWCYGNLYGILLVQTDKQQNVCSYQFVSWAGGFMVARDSDGCFTLTRYRVQYRRPSESQDA